MVIATALFADQLGVLHGVETIAASEDGGSYVRFGYHLQNDKDPWLEVRGTVYRLNAGGEDVRLWEFRDFYTLHGVRIFLSFRGDHMVIVHPQVPGRALRPDDKGIAFYERGKLVKSYSPKELILDHSEIPRTTGSYIWVRRSHLIPDEDTLEKKELEIWPLGLFWLRTTDGVLYAFKLSTGEIVRREPNKTHQHNAGGRPPMNDSPASDTPSSPAPRG